VHTVPLSYPINGCLCDLTFYVLCCRKSKLLDDDEDDGELPIKQTQATVGWHEPSLLPERPDVAKAQLDSRELLAQIERTKTVTLASYFSDADVPASPAPISDIEQAIDMTSQSSAVVASIPFFIPTPQPIEPIPAPQPTSIYPNTSQFAPSVQGAVGHSPSSVGATPELVQSLGLPMFLVGQDVQALHTLASSPGLLGTLVDSSGMYDQQRLMNLVQTLSISQGQQSGQQGGHHSAYSAGASAYAPTPSSSNIYAPPPSMQSAYPPSGSFRTKSDDGNLHVSGYGPSTTQADIINLFAPYVQVDEVVMKGTFSFINTADPNNAQRAREALHGTLLGGMPIRINSAQRKNKDSSGGFGGAPTSSFYGPPGAAPLPSFGGPKFGPPGAGRPPMAPATPSFGRVPGVAIMGLGGAMGPPGGPRAPPGPPPGPLPVANMNIPIEAVRDDRGNAPTKNLFVAGYGAGTTEQQLRDIFGLHCSVIGVILKGNFSFVNTSTIGDAVRSRQALQGTNLNGGPLRINFAKETGRLGTSFDLTYNERSGPNARRPGPGMPPGPPPPQQRMSYYGR
jgi:RNA recognition motif-containing protein